MLANDQHYQVTKQRVAHFAASLASLQHTPRPAHVPPRLHQAMQDSVASQLADLCQEVAAYEAQQAVQGVPLELHSLRDLPDLLMQARLAHGYTHADLAQRVHCTPQQLQRYEATRYRAVSFHRMLAIAQALAVDLAETVRLTRAG